MLISATTDRPDNQIRFSFEAQTVIFEIESPRGIGQAYIWWLGGIEPDRILLRLHLRGLEELRLTYGDTVRTVTIQSTDAGVVQQSIASVDAPAERMITPDDSLWMPTQIVTPAHDRPAIPLRAGYIEVELPPGVLNRATPQLTVHWVDFFR